MKTLELKTVRGINICISIEKIIYLSERPFSRCLIHLPSVFWAFDRIGLCNKEDWCCD